MPSLNVMATKEGYLFARYSTALSDTVRIEGYYNSYSSTVYGRTGGLLAAVTVEMLSDKTAQKREKRFRFPLS